MPNRLCACENAHYPMKTFSQINSIHRRHHYFLWGSYAFSKQYAPLVQCYLLNSPWSPGSLLISCASTHNWLLPSNCTPDGPSFINTSRPKQNGQHFAENIFRWIFFNWNYGILTKLSETQTKWLAFCRKHVQIIFLNENYDILIKLSWAFVLLCLIENKSLLFQLMDCYQVWNQTITWFKPRICFVPNRGQSITWTNDDPVHWHIWYMYHQA